METDTTIE